MNSTCRRLTPGSLIRRSASVPRPTTRPGRLERVAGAVDLEERAGAAYLGVGGVADHRGVRLAADPEPAGGEVVGGLEADRDRAGEDVALLRRRARWSCVGELLDQRRVVRREPVEVGLRTARRGSRWGPAAARGTGSGRCCRTRAGGRRRSRPAARRCGTPGRRPRRPAARAAARTSAGRSRRTSSPPRVDCAARRPPRRRPTRPGGTRPERGRVAPIVSVAGRGATAQRRRAVACDPADPLVPGLGASERLG